MHHMKNIHTCNLLKSVDNSTPSAQHCRACSATYTSLPLHLTLHTQTSPPPTLNPTQTRNDTFPSFEESTSVRAKFSSSHSARTPAQATRRGAAPPHLDVKNGRETARGLIMRKTTKHCRAQDVSEKKSQEGAEKVPRFRYNTRKKPPPPDRRTAVDVCMQ